VHGLKRDDVSGRELDDPRLVSPIIMSMRILDESEDIRAMLDLIYALHVEERVTICRLSSNERCRACTARRHASQCVA